VRDLLELPAAVLEIVHGVGWRWLFAILAAVVVVGLPVAVLAAFLTPVAYRIDESFFVLRGGYLHVYLLSRLWLALVAAVLAGTFVGLGAVLSTRPGTSVAEALEGVFYRIHRLALVYLPPAVGFAFALFTPLDRMRYSHRTWSSGGVFELLSELLAFGFFLLWVRLFALAPVAVALGKGVVESLRLGHSVARGHRMLALATTLLPVLLVVGCFVSFVFVVETSKSGPHGLLGPDATAALAVLVFLASFIVAPFFAGVLKVAAWRIATRSEA